jgi:biotin transport system substrate-specific component
MRKVGEVVKTKRLAIMGLMVALMSISAWVQIPIPTPLGNMPLTLQTAIAALAAMLLSPMEAFVAMGVYVALGLCGVPVFSSGGGLGYTLYPTFGYLIGFALGAPMGSAYLGRKPTGRYPRAGLAKGLLAGIETGENKKPGQLRFGQCFVAGITVVLVVFGCGLGYTWWLARYVAGSPVAFASLLTALITILYLKDVILVTIIAGIAPRLRKHIDGSPPACE